MAAILPWPWCFNFDIYIYIYIYIYVYIYIYIYILYITSFPHVSWHHAKQNYHFLAKKIPCHLNPGAQRIQNLLTTCYGRYERKKNKRCYSRLQGLLDAYLWRAILAQPRMGRQVIKITLFRCLIVDFICRSATRLPEILSVAFNNSV